MRQRRARTPRKTHVILSIEGDTTPENRVDYYHQWIHSLHRVIRTLIYLGDTHTKLVPEGRSGWLRPGRHQEIRWREIFILTSGLLAPFILFLYPIFSFFFFLCFNTVNEIFPGQFCYTWPILLVFDSFCFSCSDLGWWILSCELHIGQEVLGEGHWSAISEGKSHIIPLGIVLSR